jgi:hypothetical protein
MGICSIIVKLVNIVSCIALLVLVYASQGYQVPWLTGSEDSPTQAFMQTIEKFLIDTHAPPDTQDIFSRTLLAASGLPLFNSVLGMSWFIFVMALAILFA